MVPSQDNWDSDTSPLQQWLPQELLGFSVSHSSSMIIDTDIHTPASKLCLLCVACLIKIEIQILGFNLNVRKAK